MNRTEKLKRYLAATGRKKGYVAKEVLGVPPQMMTYLLNHDIDQIVQRIDALAVETPKASRRRAA